LPPADGKASIDVNNERLRRNYIISMPASRAGTPSLALEPWQIAFGTDSPWTFAISPRLFRRAMKRDGRG